MAADIAILFQQLQRANSAEKRPDRAIRDYVRNITKSPYSGQLTLGKLSKTIAYAKRPELRNGHTAKVSVPETDITLEIQLFETHEAEAQSLTKLTFSVLKYDGYSKTLFAQQEPWQEITKEAHTKQQTTPETDTIASNEVSPSAEDPLAKFQEEALANLSSHDTDVVSDTSEEERLLAQMQLEAANALAGLTSNLDRQIESGNEDLPAETVAASTPDHFPHENEPLSLDDTTTGDLEANEPPPEKEATPNRDQTSHEEQTQPEKPTPVVNTPVQKKEPEPAQAAETSDSKQQATLDDLMALALGDDQKPVTQDLFSAIVSLQTGIPKNTVAQIQNAMWLTLSSPETFGSGKASYQFPLLGNFTVHKHDGEFNLDFASSDISSIEAAKINEEVNFEQAKEHVESKSGPLVARHAFALALATAASLGVGQAKTYQTVYRSILLLLRIFGKGERRVRIEEIGEFFPSVIAGSAAYRFRAYPTFIRATSAAFKDAVAFASKPGEAQLEFENKQSGRINNSEPQQETNAVKGCLIFVAIIIFYLLLTAI